MKSVTDRKSTLAFVTSSTVFSQGKRRRVVIEVHRNGMTADARLEGTRGRFPFDFEGVYTRAVLNAALRAKREKKAGKR
jgi:hypothetical protein